MRGFLLQYDSAMNATMKSENNILDKTRKLVETGADTMVFDINNKQKSKKTFFSLSLSVARVEIK